MKMMRQWKVAGALVCFFAISSLLPSVCSGAPTLKETNEWLMGKKELFKNVAYTLRASQSGGPIRANLFDETITHFDLTEFKLSVSRRISIQSRLEYSTTGVVDEMKRGNLRQERFSDTFHDDIDLCKDVQEAQVISINAAGAGTLDPPIWAISFKNAPSSWTPQQLAKFGLIKFQDRELALRVSKALRHVQTLCRNSAAGESRKPVGEEDLKKKEAAEAARRQLIAEDEARRQHETFWESIKNSSDPSDFQAYLKAYPNGAYAAIARNRLPRLKKEAAAKAEAERCKILKAAAKADWLKPPCTIFYHGPECDCP